MRLWHQSLIHYLPRQQLLGQHRECCALRGEGWGKKHSVVDYVFKHSRALLYAYHCCVMEEMTARGYETDGKWDNHNYRGKAIGYVFDDNDAEADLVMLYEKDPCWEKIYAGEIIVYPEHNDIYLKECLENLKSKGARLINGKTISGMLIELAIRTGI